MGFVMGCCSTLFLSSSLPISCMHNLPLDDVIVHTLWTTFGSFSLSFTFLTFSVADFVSCSFLGFWELIVFLHHFCIYFWS